MISFWYFSVTEYYFGKKVNSVFNPTVNIINIDRDRKTKLIKKKYLRKVRMTILMCGCRIPIT